MDRDYGPAQAATTTTHTPAAKPTSKAAKCVTPDWETIELDYRAGIKTLRQMADEHGISHGAINKRAKRHGWERDLSAKIHARADALVSKEAVSKQVSTETKIAERDLIEANACAIVEVRLGQRRDIQRSRALSMALLAELEQMVGADTVEMLAELGEIMRQPGDKGQDRRNDLYQKIISLPERVKTMKDLGETMRVLVTLERQAFGLDDKANEAVDGLTAVLHEIAGRSTNGFKPVAHDPEYDDEDNG